MLRRKRKAKAMAPQTETVQLPEPKRLEGEGAPWVFPTGWSDEDIRDWLATHPEHDRPQVVSLPDPDVETGECDAECGGADQDQMEFHPFQPGDPLNSGGENGVDKEATEAEVISALKADGVYAAALALPLELQDKVTHENYDPREFFLVHSDVWNEMVQATIAEADLGLENKALKRRVNALTRGMRKVNRHWSATKNLLKQEQKSHRADVVWWTDRGFDQIEKHAEEIKRERILTTRVARRLRKARAGRDKRERQLVQANQTIEAQAHIMNKQDEYIAYLERQVTGRFHQ